jgi:hypothetical protein
VEFFDFMISDLEKDESIKFVLNELHNRFGAESFRLADYWEADLCAVGIKSKNDGDYLIYISTWKKLPNTYFVEIEKENSTSDLTNYTVVERLENLGIEDLSELVKKYLI